MSYLLTSLPIQNRDQVIAVAIFSTHHQKSSFGSATFRFIIFLFNQRFRPVNFISNFKKLES